MTMDGISVMNKEYNQIVNLIKFNVNFSKFIHNNDLLSHSPDCNYIHGWEPVKLTKKESRDLKLKKLLSNN